MEQLKNRFGDIGIFSADKLSPTFHYGDPTSKPPHCLCEFEPNEASAKHD
jgi:hypothetical protein